MSGRLNTANTATVTVRTWIPRQNTSAAGRCTRTRRRHLVSSHPAPSSHARSSGFCTLARRHLDTARRKCESACRRNHDDQEEVERQQCDSDQAHCKQRLALCTRFAPEADRAPRRQRVGQRKEHEVHDVVVRAVGGHHHTHTTRNGRQDAAALERAAHEEREDRQHPRRQQVEVPEKMRGDVWRSAKGDAGEMAARRSRSTSKTSAYAPRALSSTETKM